MLDALPTFSYPETLNQWFWINLKTFLNAVFICSLSDAIKFIVKNCCEWKTKLISYRHTALRQTQCSNATLLHGQNPNEDRRMNCSVNCEFSELIWIETKGWSVKCVWSDLVERTSKTIYSLWVKWLKQTQFRQLRQPKDYQGLPRITEDYRGSPADATRTRSSLKVSGRAGRGSTLAGVDLRAHCFQDGISLYVTNVSLSHSFQVAR